MKHTFPDTTTTLTRSAVKSLCTEAVVGMLTDLQVKGNAWPLVQVSTQLSLSGHLAVRPINTSDFYAVFVALF